MRKIEITSFVYVLDIKEAEIIEKTLVYALHRIVQHKNTGANYIASAEQIRKLLSQFK